jgi:hypothetical protein
MLDMQYLRHERQVRRSRQHWRRRSIGLVRCHLLHCDWVQASYAYRRRYAYWVGFGFFIFPRIILICPRCDSAIMIALGEVYSGVFSVRSSLSLWVNMSWTNRMNGIDLWPTLGRPPHGRRDRVRPLLAHAPGWRIRATDLFLQRWLAECTSFSCSLPLHYTILTTIFIDIQTGGRPGGSCTAALFLKPFAEGIEAKDGQEPAMKWAHLDIAGSMEVRCYVYPCGFVFRSSFANLSINRPRGRARTRRRVWLAALFGMFFIDIFLFFNFNPLLFSFF